jgi:hypothetical protein
MKKYEKILSIMPEGFGQKRIKVLYYGKEINAHYTEMPTIDLFKSEEKGYKTAGNRIYNYVVLKNQTK